MKRLIFIVLILCLAESVQAQPSLVLPYITKYIRTLLDDPNAMEARNTLELGAAHDPNFTSINLSGDHINIATSKTPTSASDTGTQGDIAWDEDYIYVCISTNTWKRVAISTWAEGTDYLLLETGDYLLLETGDKLYLEN